MFTGFSDSQSNYFLKNYGNKLFACFETTYTPRRHPASTMPTRAMFAKIPDMFGKVRCSPFKQLKENVFSDCVREIVEKLGETFSKL